MVAVSRSWCFTIHAGAAVAAAAVGETSSVPDEEVNRWMSGTVHFEKYQHMINYAVWQIERGHGHGGSGRLHVQGYIECKKPMRMKAVRMMVSGKAHLEARRGTREQARAYCMKMDSRVAGPWEYGVFREGYQRRGKGGVRGGGAGGQGTRTALQQVKMLLDAGVSVKAMNRDHFELWAKHDKVIHNHLQLNAVERSTKTKLHVFLGDPGTGKSSYCRMVSPYVFLETIW